MINFLCSLTILTSFCTSPQLGALSILKPSQGGTGIGSATVGDVGKVLKVSDDSPFTFELANDETGSGGGAAAVATSTGETAGNIAYWTSTNATPALLGKVATSSVTYNSPLTTSGTAGFIVGGSGFTVDIDDIQAADLDLTDITLADFTNDTNFITLSSLSATWPITYNSGTGAFSWVGLATTSNPTAGNLFYSNGTTGLTPVATSSVTINAPLTSAGTPGFVVGGSGWTIDIDDIKAADLDLTDITLNDFTNDAGFITGNQTITLSGDVTGSGTTGITTTIANGAIDTFDLATTSAIADGEFLQFDTDGTFYGVTCAEITGSVDLCDGVDAGGTNAFEIATTSTIAVPQLAYFTQVSGRTTLGGVATTTLTATSPLSLSQALDVLGASPSALSITDAVADGATKGAASFTANDFNSSSGNISIDYTNGQSAASGVKGFLTGTDWDTFNAKESALSFTYPLTRAVNAISLAFGTTTSNLWGGTQTFTNSPIFTSLTGGLVVSNSGSDAIFNVATTTLTLPSTAPFNPSGTLGNLVGGTNFTLGYYGIATSSAIANTEVIYGTAVNTIDSEAAFSYNATADRLTVTHASTTASSMTNLNVSGIAVLPSGTAPVVASAGAAANDTSTINGLTQWVYGASANVLQPMSWRVAGHATSTWTGTTTQLIAPAPAAITVTTARCETTTGTVGVSLYDGTNRANFFTASTTIGTITFSTNNTFTAGESMRVDFGTPASSPVQVACHFGYTYTRQ